ncbi:MAG: glycerol acyltransferase [Anaerolineae bacterium]|nr:glycerol acyltransferase [Anaerolineae bacterium]
MNALTEVQSTLNRTNNNEHEPIEDLIDINSKDLLQAFGIGEGFRGRGTLMRLVRPLAKRFAHQVLAYDADVGRNGLSAATQAYLHHNVGSVEYSGLEHVRGDGPLLIASNHPGMSDALALFAILKLDNLRIIARDRDFLRAMPNIMSHLLIVSDVESERIRATRAVSGLLKAGHPVLTFPAGKIEPDPASMPGAVASLASWSSSLDLFSRLVPQLCVVPVIVRGVISQEALRNPIIRVRRDPKDRNWLAATLQIVVRAYQNVQVRVSFGEPVRLAQLQAGGTMTQAITRNAKRLIENPPTRLQTLSLIRTSNPS